MTNFTRHYLTAALWSSCDDQDRPLDERFQPEDLHPEALLKAESDCAAFLLRAGNLVTPYEESQVAHDFWLTRNGHGSGFWDGAPYTDEDGATLTEIAKSFGECDPYIGDDGALYLFPANPSGPPGGLVSRPSPRQCGLTHQHEGHARR